MDSNKQKRKTNHVVIVTSDAVDANVKQFRIRPWVMWLAIIAICVLLGTGLGYILYEDQIWGAANAKIDEYKLQIKELQIEINNQQDEAAKEKGRLESEIEKLEKDNTILKETVNLIREEKEEIAAVTEKQHNPSMLPLTGGATIEEISEGEPMCLFNATDGALVIATASGTVSEIVEEPEYGYKVSIDHGNGYVTIYRNKEVPKVKQGENIIQGMSIFVVTDNSMKLGYQVLKDGEYINPMDVIEIEG